MHCPFDQYHVLQVVAKNKEFNCIYIQQIREIRTFIYHIMIILKSIFIKAVSVTEKRYVQISFADYIFERKQFVYKFIFTSNGKVC